MKKALVASLCLLAVVLTNTDGLASGVSDGVTVHGHWKIEVLEPDGTLVSVTEFENAFVGGSMLAALLTRDLAIGLWSVWLEDSSGSGACFDGTNAKPCVLRESTYTPSGSGWEFNNLQVVSQGNPVVVLHGTAQASYSDTIEVVATVMNACATTQPLGSNCNDPSMTSAFTSTTLSSPVSVQPNQHIQVTVSISFN
jgi:hypothetical protein